MADCSLKHAKSSQRLSVVLAVTATFLSAAAFAQTPMFSVTVLPNLPGGTSSGAYGVNDAGDVVGVVIGSAACPMDDFCAVIWQDGTPAPLGAVAGAIRISAAGINNAGQVVGNIVTANGDNQAVIWNNRTPTLLPSPAAQYTQTFASFVNAAGQVVGYAQSDSSQVAVMWNGLTPIELGLGANEFGEALGINSSGLIVGEVHNVPVVWHGTQPTKLPINPGSNGGKALALNNAGIVVGVTTESGTLYGSRAAAWANGGMTDLGTLNGQSSATAINNRGIIVGKSWATGAKGPHAVVWSRMAAPVQDLNDLISATDSQALILQFAYSINDNCSIAVQGLTRQTKTYQAVVLTLNDPSQCVNGGF
jgi:probable HAF family extracellular repeat protein